MALGTIGTVVVAEQLCVKREMMVGLEVDVEADDAEEADDDSDEEVESMEMGRLPPRRD